MSKYDIKQIIFKCCHRSEMVTLDKELKKKTEEEKALVSVLKNVFYTTGR